jgi:Flp pilus assembly protein TadD
MRGAQTDAGARRQVGDAGWRHGGAPESSREIYCDAGPAAIRAVAYGTCGNYLCAAAAVVAAVDKDRAAGHDPMTIGYRAPAMAKSIVELPDAQVTRLIQADRRQFAVLLGAGASCSSGVDSAGAMIREWRAMAHRDSRSVEPLDDWCCRQPWYGKDHEYSELFERLYPNAQARQTYIERKIAGAFPGWGYLYLANLIGNDWFNVILTTNFDDLLADALSLYADYVPVVCAADSEVLGVSLAARRAKIIKLHGDYLFKRLKNTVEELRQLDPNMKQKFDQVAQYLGLLVIGYGGRDHSVMSLLEGSLARAESFGPGVYWGLWRDEQPAAMVEALARAHPDRVHLFRYHDFDVFMAELHAACGPALPAAVVDPFGALRGKLAALLRGAADPAAEAAGIAQDRAKLRQQLELPWARQDAAGLLQAQIAVSRRDPAEALRHVHDYAARHPEDSQALTVWASALIQRSEDQGSEADRDEATGKLREAVRLDGDNLAARYNLFVTLQRRELDAEAIAAGEELVRRVPNDKYLRFALAQLYLKKGRMAEALAVIRDSLARDPTDAYLHLQWSLVMARNGSSSQALEAVDRAIALQPNNAAFHSQRGHILFQMTRIRDAVAAFEEAVRLDPEDHYNRVLLARGHMMVGAPDAAFAQARLALKNYPESVEATGLLGSIHLLRGETQQALECFDRLVKMTPTDPRSWTSRAQLHLQLGHTQEAERDFLEAVRISPQEPNFIANLAWLYRSTGRADRLKAVMDELFRISPQGAQMLQMQMAAPQMMPGATGQGQGLLQRILGSLR